MGNLISGQCGRQAPPIEALPVPSRQPSLASSAETNSETSESPTSAGPDVVKLEANCPWTITHIEQECVPYLWIVERCSTALAADCANTIKSRTFNGAPKNLHTWQLEAVLCTETGRISVYLVLKNIRYGKSYWRYAKKNIQAKYQLVFFDSMERVRRRFGGQKMKPETFQIDERKGCANINCLPDLLHPKSKRPFLAYDDVLRIKCTIWMDGQVVHKSGKGYDHLSDGEWNLRNYEQLKADWIQALEDSSFADVIIKTRTESLNAHKAVLAARSPVFKAMFTVSMLESAKNTVNLIDFDSNVVKSMLEYLYTGGTTFLSVMPSELLQIAEKYDIQGLKGHCEYKLARDLSFENCHDLMVLAELHNAPYLKAAAVEYMARNTDDVILKSKSFQKLNIISLSR